MAKPKSQLCPLCNEELTDSPEHIFPWSIGGRKAVTGFICEKCNHDTGSRWDGPLFDQLHSLCNEFRIRRQSGKGRKTAVPKREYQLSDGTPVFKCSDGTVEPIVSLGPPVVSKSDGKTIHEFKYSGSPGSVFREVKKRKKEYRSKESKGQISNLEISEPLVTEQIRNINEVVPENTSLGGDEFTSRSIVKTALAAAFDAGLEPTICDKALEFLVDLSGSAKHPYQPFEFQKIYPAHSVLVIGSTGEKRLTAELVYFGCLGFRVTLSESYEGPSLAYAYVLDPLRGKDQTHFIGDWNG